MTHKCNRDDCLRENVNGPKAKCTKCNNLCYLKCFGFEKCATMDNIDVIRYPLPNGGAIHTFLPHIAFVCCNESITTAELKANMKVPPKTRGTSQTRQAKQPVENTMIMNEIAEIKDKITKMNITTEKNTTELSSIKTTVNENNVLCKSLENKANVSSTATHNNQFTKTPTFARIVADNRRLLTPKRKLDTVNKPKQLSENWPKPVCGTRDINIGPRPKPVTLEKANANKARNTRANFDKSIWVSGLAPATTNEEMMDFVLKASGSEDKNQFNCRKLVKKDADIDQLSYISFKIDANEQLFEQLMNPDIWPNYVRIRQFIQAEPVTLGAFLDVARATPPKQQKVETKNGQQTSMEH